MDADILQHIPQTPGIYLFKDKKGGILYIGKAKNLKKRVTQYLVPSSVWKQEMVARAENIERMVVENEGEALYLEDNLIKQHQPEWNNLLKGGNSYAYIKIPKTTFPQILITRKKIPDGARYIGPKHDTKALKQFLQYLRQVFQFRACPRSQFRQGKVCSDFYFGLCKGWCQVSCQTEEKKQQYAQDMELIQKFFKGDTGPISREMKHQIDLAIKDQRFEWAAKLRDMYLKIDQLGQQQTVVLQTPYTGYIAHMTKLKDNRLWVLLVIHQGKLVDILREITHQEEIDEYSLKVMLEVQCGPLKKRGEYLISPEFKTILPEERSQLVTLIDRAKQSFLAYHSFQDHTVMNDLLQTLQERYQLSVFPFTMECIDISHLGGDWTSGGLSCMQGGVPYPKGYRKYRMHSSNDDYMALQELITRRIQYDMPDILVIDGGKGQLGVWKKLIKTNPEIQERCKNTQVIALGKGQARKKSHIGMMTDTGVIGEEILWYDEDWKIQKKKMIYDEADKLLIQLRNESHRFANAYRKKQMSKEIPSR